MLDAANRPKSIAEARAAEDRCLARIKKCANSDDDLGRRFWISRRDYFAAFIEGRAQ